MKSVNITLPPMKWAAMKGVVYAYGINASEGTGRVMMNDARLPTATSPSEYHA